MKRLSRLICSALGLLLLLSSCQQASMLSVSGPRSYTFTRDGGTQSISFTCNRDWSISTTDSWISATPSSGSAADGESTVTIQCTPNPTYDPRTTTLTIRAEELSETITVNQDTSIGLIVSPTTYELSNAEHTIEIEVQKNVPYTVAIDNESAAWIKQGGTRALTTDKITFTISANSSYDNREGRIVFKQLDGDLAGTVIIKQAYGEGLIVEKTKYEMPYGGGEIKIKVKSNVSFDVTPIADWIHHVQTKALNTSTVLLMIDENATFSARVGEVEIKQQNGPLNHTILVYQAGRIAVTSVKLNKTMLQLEVGASETLIATVNPDNAADKTLKWTSSDERVATVDQSGKVTALLKGMATIKAEANDGSGVFASCAVLVRVPYTAVAGDAVDLGLSVKWSSMNLGATSPTEYGDYFAWGETSPKDVFRWETYEYGARPNLMKYNTLGSYGPVDNKTEFKDYNYEDDAARQALGGKWRTPTSEEWMELIDMCTWTYAIRNGIKGILVTSKTNYNSIFLPAAGGRGKSPFFEGSWGFYWSSSLRTDYPDCAWTVTFDSGYFVINSSGRSDGYSVRPVLEQ